MLNSPALIGRIGRANRGSLLLYPAYVQDYLDRVTAADVAAGDTAGLERGVTDAFNQALQGMVSDQVLGISDGVIAQAPSIIKAMPFMAGARTLSGCLTPVVGPAPTNFNFVPPDYNRKTGLLGDGATKHLGSNRNNNADPQDSNHNAVFVSAAHSGGTVGAYIASGAVGPGRNSMGQNAAVELFTRNRSVTPQLFSGVPVGFAGHSRSQSSQFLLRTSGQSITVAVASEIPENTNIDIFRRGTASYCNGRIAYYSIGEALDLALLDARITTLINAIGAALP